MNPKKYNKHIPDRIYHDIMSKAFIQKHLYNDYRRLNSVRRPLLCHDHHEYMNRIALKGDDHLNECQIRDAFATLRKLK